MELSILVAKIIAIIYLSSGVMALRGKVSFKKMTEDFDKSSSLTFITGFITVIFGMILVEYHNIWVRDWTVLITILGWASLLKGIMFIAFPETISQFRGAYRNNKLWGILLIILGLVFGYFGFFIR